MYFVKGKYGVRKVRSESYMSKLQEDNKYHFIVKLKNDNFYRYYISDSSEFVRGRPPLDYLRIKYFTDIKENPIAYTMFLSVRNRERKFKQNYLMDHIYNLKERATAA